MEPSRWAETAGREKKIDVATWKSQPWPIDCDLVRSMGMPVMLLSELGNGTSGAHHPSLPAN
jgi:hypothetical protein